MMFINAEDTSVASIASISGHLAPPHTHNGAYILTLLPRWLSRDRRVSRRFRRAAPVRQEESDRRGAERNGRRSYHFARATRRAPGAVARWWGRRRVAPPASGEEARCAWVGRPGTIAERENGAGPPRSVRVHSPNSASGCDRSYLTRLRSRHAESKQSFDSPAIESFARVIGESGRPPFFRRRPNPFPRLDRPESRE